LDRNRRIEASASRLIPEPVTTPDIVVTPAILQPDPEPVNYSQFDLAVKNATDKWKASIVDKYRHLEFSDDFVVLVAQKLEKVNPPMFGDQRQIQSMETENRKQYKIFGVPAQSKDPPKAAKKTPPKAGPRANNMNKIICWRKSNFRKQYEYCRMVFG
jgi:hypothetical protein